MRFYPILLALFVGIWATLGVINYNAPVNPTAADLEIHCRYGLCEDRDMATLARYRSFLVDAGQDPQVYRNLLLQSPASPELWCDLGEALREQNRPADADVAFDHAVSLAPNSPSILIRAATAQLLAAKPANALPLFYRIFEKVPDYPSGNVFSLCDRFGVSPAQMLAAVLPPDQPHPAAAYLRFLIRTANPQAASATWTWIQAHSLSTPPLTREYSSFLLSRKAYAPALAVWSAGSQPKPTGVLFDPGFEFPPSLPPFGWKIDPAPATDFEIVRDPAEHHSGAAAVRIRFAGNENVTFRHLSQLVVPHAPGVYQFSFWSKTDSLTTNQGLHVAIEDAEHPGNPLWISEPALTGTQPWTRTSTTITVPAAVPLLRILVLRYPSNKIENKISGTAWFDDFDFHSLAPCHPPCLTGTTDALQR